MAFTRGKILTWLLGAFSNVCPYYEMESSMIF